jgi:predicted TIM-barrel fold metal-dependent hydrolase
MSDEGDIDILIQTGLQNPIGVGLAKSLLQEAGIPFFTMDQNISARQESGNFIGWWSVRVPREREAEAREILRTVEEMK